MKSALFPHKGTFHFIRDTFGLIKGSKKINDRYSNWPNFASNKYFLATEELKSSPLSAETRWYSLFQPPEKSVLQLKLHSPVILMLRNEKQKDFWENNKNSDL